MSVSKKLSCLVCLWFTAFSLLHKPGRFYSHIIAKGSEELFQIHTFRVKGRLESQSCIQKAIGISTGVLNGWPFKSHMSLDHANAVDQLCKGINDLKYEKIMLFLLNYNFVFIVCSKNFYWIIALQYTQEIRIFPENLVPHSLFFSHLNSCLQFQNVI